MSLANQGPSKSLLWMMLRLLEEYGEEDLCALLNSLEPMLENFGSGRDVVDYLDALEELTSVGWVTVERERTQSCSRPFELSASVARDLVFNPFKKQWDWKSPRGATVCLDLLDGSVTWWDVMLDLSAKDGEEDLVDLYNSVYEHHPDYAREDTVCYFLKAIDRMRTFGLIDVKTVPTGDLSIEAMAAFFRFEPEGDEGDGVWGWIGQQAVRVHSVV